MKQGRQASSTCLCAPRFFKFLALYLGGQIGAAERLIFSTPLALPTHRVSPCLAGAVTFSPAKDQSSPTYLSQSRQRYLFAFCR